MINPGAEEEGEEAVAADVEVLIAPAVGEKVEMGGVPSQLPLAAARLQSTTLTNSLPSPDVRIADMLLVVAEDERQANRTMTTDDIKKEQRRMSRRVSRAHALTKKLSSSRIPRDCTCGGESSSTTTADSSRNRDAVHATKATSSSPPATPIQPEAIELVPAPMSVQPQQLEQQQPDTTPTPLSPEAAQAARRARQLAALRAESNPAAGVDAKVERAAEAGPSSAVVEKTNDVSESDGGGTCVTRKVTGDKETLVAMSASIRKKMAHLEFMAAVYVQRMARAWLTRQREKEADDWGDDDVCSPASTIPRPLIRAALLVTHHLLSRCVLAG